MKHIPDIRVYEPCIQHHTLILIVFWLSLHCYNLVRDNIMKIIRHGYSIRFV